MSITSGKRDLGIFAALTYLMVAGNTVIGALGQSAISRLARCYAGRDRWVFCRLLLKLLGVAAFLGAAGILASWVAGREMIAIIYSKEYTNEISTLIIIMINSLLYYISSILGYGMTAARYFRPQLPLFGLSGAASFLACLWLVPAYGLKGAAWAGLLASVVQLVGSLGVNAHALLCRSGEGP